MAEPVAPQGPKFSFQTLVADLSAALGVSFLTIAAGSAFGLLTGLGAQAGILSMIVASLAAWVFRGEPVKVSGPTGPTAAAMIAAIGALAVYDAPPQAAFVAMAVAGIGLIALSFLPLARAMALIPNAATAVFVNGISLIILLKQGVKLNEYIGLSGAERFFELALALGTLVLLIYWPVLSRPLARFRMGKLLSGSLIAMVLGGLLTAMFDLPVARLDIDAFDLTTLIRISTEAVATVPLGVLLIVAAKMTLTIAFVTLATARALFDHSNYGAELRNQAAGNIAVAAVGGVPSTIGFVRTRILKRSGGRTSFAGIATALIVSGIVLGTPGLLGTIPTSIFVGILFRAAWTSIDWRFLTSFRADPKANALTFVIVTVGSFAMVSFDHVLVVLFATLVWHAGRRLPKLRQMCPDIKTCPIAHQPPIGEM